MKASKEWSCKECGKHTNNPDKVCMVCRTEDTVVRGLVSKKAAGKE